MSELRKKVVIVLTYCEKERKEIISISRKEYFC
jgi:hypothetical protein